MVNVIIIFSLFHTVMNDSYLLISLVEEFQTDEMDTIRRTAINHLVRAGVDLPLHAALHFSNDYFIRHMAYIRLPYTNAANYVPALVVV